LLTQKYFSRIISALTSCCVA